MVPRRLDNLLLIGGDWLALGLFVLIGQAEHELLSSGGSWRWLTTTAVLAGPWTAVAFLLGAYRWRPETAVRPLLTRSLTAWLVAAPLALILRAYLNDQATIVLIFMVITMGLGGAFLLGWRLLFIAWRRRFRAASPLTPPTPRQTPSPRPRSPPPPPPAAGSSG